MFTLFKVVLLSYFENYYYINYIIEKNNIGYGCKLCNLDEYVNKVIFMHNNRKKFKVMGKNARKLALNEFNREKLALKALTIIEKTVKNK